MTEKRKDVERLARQVVDGITGMRQELAMRDGQVQHLTARVADLEQQLRYWEQRALGGGTHG